MNVHSVIWIDPDWHAKACRFNDLTDMAHLSLTLGTVEAVN